MAVSELSVSTASPEGRRIAADCVALTINYNTAAQTVRCVQSLLDGTQVPARIYMLDNGSAPADLAALQEQLPKQTACPVHLLASTVNLGFAEGSNALLARALEDPVTQFVLMLNNDAVAMPALLERLRQALLEGQDDNMHMAGARMHRLDAPGEVDTLGIALYASLMPADRKSLDDPFVGPTGGCAMYTRILLDDLRLLTGHWFDGRFFCYCEDTDLTLRARMRGFGAVFVDEPLALHEGQASSQQAPSNFIAYHGLRNSIWMHLKLMPARLLWKYGVLLLMAHAATAVRYVLGGRAKVLRRIYRDAAAERRPFLEERRQWKAWAPDAARQLQPLIAPRFYRRGYLRLVWRQWWQRRRTVN